ncbi:Cobalamin biosynthesis protein CbiG / Cobalt-precorrin-3b C17-methyltransferase [Pseudonocardia sp. Ae707_Ps1]|nr:Cobalamin biosynthesis protein CbiG / Cobalt-precorrin-3b C17-methyltransferase [Pseudonocardia sp. Ae707_Ps1]
MPGGCGAPAADRCGPAPAVRAGPAVTTGSPDGLVVGIGARPGCSEDAVRRLLDRVAVAHGLDLASADVATLDRRVGEPGLRAAVAPRVPRGFTATELAGVAVPHPSERVAATTGTPGVAEAAALLAAGPGAELVVPKTTGTGVTAAVARRP